MPQLQHIEHWTLLPGSLSAGLFQAARLVRAQFARRVPGAQAADAATRSVETYKSVAELPEDVAKLIDSHALENMQFGRPWLGSNRRRYKRGLSCGDAANQWRFRNLCRYVTNS